MEKRITDRDRETILAFMWCQDETLVYKSIRQTKKNATLSHTHTHTHTIQSNPPTRWFALSFLLTTRVQPEKLSAAMAMAMA